MVNHPRRHCGLYGNHILTARVLPDPVCAIPTTSFPIRATGQSWAWMALGAEKPCFLKLQHAEVKNILTKATKSCHTEDLTH